MGALTLTHYLIIAAIVVVLIGFIVILTKRKKDESNLSVDTKHILQAIGKDNIDTIEYSRHKIVVKTHDVKQCNLQALKETGAVGINVVGPIIKFYYPTDNDKVYESLKLERNG